VFEIASRQKLRFESPKGLLCIEDLWDLPLSSSASRANLDDIAISLHRQLRATGDVVSFVDDKATVDPTVKLRFDIVKHIIDVRKRENTEESLAKERAQTKQRIMEIIAKKKDSSLEAMSEEDLLKKLSEL
jgi:hypothetical protein